MPINQRGTNRYRSGGVLTNRFVNAKQKKVKSKKENTKKSTKDEGEEEKNGDDEASEEVKEKVTILKENEGEKKTENG